VALAGLGATRLIGIDTPEVFFGVECYGAEASSFTGQQLASGTKVFYAFDAERTDNFERDLVYIWRSDGTFINAEMARRGYAVPLTIAPNDRYADLFQNLAGKARRAERGLWAESTCGGNPDLPVGGGGESGRGADGSGSSGGAPSTGDKDCADFSSHSEAQDYFESKGGPASAPDRLDGDNDGLACESL